MEIIKPYKNNITTDLKVIVTGTFSWLVLAFASIKLSVIYSTKPTIAFLLAYNISGILFLIYSYAYLKYRLKFKYLLLLIFMYNSGIHLSELIYNKTILIYQRETNIALIITSSLINLFVMVMTYFVLVKFLKYTKK